MKASELVRREVGESAWSLARLGREMGITPSSMQDRLRSERGLATSFAHRALDLLGWELVAVPKGTKLPPRSVRIDG